MNSAINLTELFLCGADIDDDDFSFNALAFPKLKTMCLSFCFYLTCDGIISLVQSGPSLQNIYVEGNVVKSYAKHPFVIANASKLEIVKAIDDSKDCDHHEKLHFLFH